MTISEANNNIGQPFKLTLFAGAKMDVIKEVQRDGTIIGEFIEAHCEDCRLKEAVPENFKKNLSLFNERAS